MRARTVDHVTLAVRDAEAAIEVLSHFGFVEDHVTVIDGGEPAAYMGMPDMVADHITLVLEGAEPRFEVQLLHFHDLAEGEHGDGPTLHQRLGFNHLCLRVDDLTAATAHLAEAGVAALSDEMHYIGRRLRMFEGPEGTTIELAQWLDE